MALRRYLFKWLFPGWPAAWLACSAASSTKSVANLEKQPEKQHPRDQHREASNFRLTCMSSWTT